MRFLLHVIFLTLPSIAQAADASKMRLASEVEIRSSLKGADNLRAAKNGYQYRPGGSVGYRISNGSICTKQMTHIDCVVVYSDGRKLEIIDSKGNREFLP
ncbi:hypothetical protein [Rhizobium sp. 21-4511-3d]